MNKCQLIRDSARKILKTAEHAKISEENLQKFATSLIEDFQKGYDYLKYSDYTCHYSEFKSAEQITDYIFVLDTLNFCFWPSDWEYDNLAAALKKVITENPQQFKPKNLKNIDQEFVKKEIFDGRDFPLLSERTRVLQEIGLRTEEYFGGEFINVIYKAERSAVKLLDILTSFYNNFQDVAIYKGEQVCFYKRSQIMIGDLYSALKDNYLFNFKDIDQLTMFPDYRVPQLLNHLDIIQYDQELDNIIKAKQVIQHGSEYEVEIRAATIQAVEMLKEMMDKGGKKLISIEIDWILWQKGEDQKDEIKPHHRVLSIFY